MKTNISKHHLSPKESDVIHSILDEEEKSFVENNQSSLSALDYQCQQIWPNWETFTKKSHVKNPSPIKETTIKPQEYVELKEKKIVSPPQSKRFPNEVSPPKPTNPHNDLVNMDINSIKSDIDSLFSRIQAVTGGSSNSSPNKIS